MQNKTRRGPKSKADNADIRARLLAAGETLYCNGGYTDVSVKDIATEAGVTQAMLRYYFSDKEGFARAVLDNGMEQFLACIADAQDSDIEKVLYEIISFLNTAPWLVRLIVRHVHLGDELRVHFLTKHAPRMLAAMQQQMLLSELKVAEDNRLQMLATMSMLMFPQIAGPAIESVLQIRLDERFARDMAAHIASLLKA